MDIEQIREYVLPLIPGNWPLLTHTWLEATARPRPDWSLPEIACAAVGGKSEYAVSGCAALGLLQLAIILVDDVLDDDLRGLHREHGAGMAANLAQAFQALSLATWQQSPMDPELKHTAVTLLSRCALETAVGQHLDATLPKGDEAAYWQVVRAKSSPFYGASLALGATLGGTDHLVRDMDTFGRLLGEAIQVRDDLMDVMATPAGPDWHGRHNLLILYAHIANHPQQARFLELYAMIGQDTAVLEEAQQILIDCGAVDYAVELLSGYQDELSTRLQAMALPNPDPLRQVVKVVTKSPFTD